LGPVVSWRRAARASGFDEPLCVTRELINNPAKSPPRRADVRSL
jgi:hypothetical protein